MSTKTPVEIQKSYYGISDEKYKYCYIAFIISYISVLLLISILSDKFLIFLKLEILQYRNYIPYFYFRKKISIYDNYIIFYYINTFAVIFIYHFLFKIFFNVKYKIIPFVLLFYFIYIWAFGADGRTIQFSEMQSGNKGIPILFSFFIPSSYALLFWVSMSMSNRNKEV